MREGVIGRGLVACVHQAIADRLPDRVVFYEHWLNGEALSVRTIGLAPMLAVMSFLRQEGDVSYAAVMERAGEYAADWHIEGQSFWERMRTGSGPRWMRRYALMRVFRRLVREMFNHSRATVRIRRGVARIVLRDSIFCGVREPVAHPLCQFYAAAARQLFSQISPEVHVSQLSCRGMDKGSTTCVISVEFVRAAAE
jgi:predicted hydrocarbon binding protein